MFELWRDIPGYEGLYQASHIGRIKSVEGKITSNAKYEKRIWKERVLKPKKSKRTNGSYDYRVELWKDGQHKSLLVSRLVAMTWCDGYKEELTVNHIDGNPANNRFDNLEWVSRPENIRKGYANGLYPQKQCILMSGNWKKGFSSMSLASQYLGRTKGYISNLLKHGKNSFVLGNKRYFVTVGGKTDAI